VGLPVFAFVLLEVGASGKPQFVDLLVFPSPIWERGQRRGNESDKPPNPPLSQRGREIAERQTVRFVEQILEVNGEY